MSITSGKLLELPGRVESLMICGPENHQSSFRCSLSLIAEAVITMRNCTMAGNIVRCPALSCLFFQAPYLLNFVEKILATISGHHGRTAVAPRGVAAIKLEDMKMR